MEKNSIKRGVNARTRASEERKLEIDCCTYARKKGIIAVKLEKNSHKGIPDYMFIAEGGATMFVEFKRPDGKGVVSDEQRYRVYSNNGEFLMLGRVLDHRMSTVKSFFEVYT